MPNGKTPSRIGSSVLAPFRNSVREESMLRLRILRWRKEDQHGEVFFDGVEAMRHVGCHKHDRAGTHRSIFVAHSDQGLAADHIVHLIFSVWTLRIDAAGG